MYTKAIKGKGEHSYEKGSLPVMYDNLFADDSNGGDGIRKQGKCAGGPVSRGFGSYKWCSNVIPGGVENRTRLYDYGGFRRWDGQQ